MLERFATLLQRVATWPRFLIALTAYGIYFPIFFFAKVPFGITAIEPYAAQGGLLDVEFFYTSAQAYQRLASFGDQGRTVYLTILLGDLLYPALLGTLLTLSIALMVRSMGRDTRLWRFVPLIPVANMVFDYAENIALITLLLRYPAQIPLLATLAGAFTTLKNIFGALAFTALLVTLLALALQRLRRR